MRIAVNRLDGSAHMPFVKGEYISRLYTKFSVRVIVMIAFACMMTLVITCAGSLSAVESAYAGQEKPAVSVTNAQTGKLALKVGSNYDLGAKVNNAGGGIVKIAYKSKKPRVVAVSKTGRLKARKAGKATVVVTAKTGKLKASKRIAVTVLAKKKYKRVKKVGLALKKSSFKNAKLKNLSLELGKSRVLKVAFLPAKASNKNAVFKSSNPGVAAVSAAGKITAKRVGTAEITVKSCANKKAKAVLRVTVKDGKAVQDPKPGESSVSADSDGDGISDFCEVTFMGTDPYKADDLSKTDLPQKIVYRDNVVCESDPGNVVSAEESNGRVSVILLEKPADAEVGKVLVVPRAPACPGGAALHIEGISERADGTFVMTGSLPELGEIIDYMSINEELWLDIDNIEVGEGVEIESVRSLSKQSASPNRLSGGALLAQDIDTGEFNSKEITFAIGKKEGEGATGDDGGGTITGKVTLRISGGHLKVVSTPELLDHVAAGLLLANPLLPAKAEGVRKAAQNIDYVDAAIYGSATPEIKFSDSILAPDVTVARVPIYGETISECGFFVEFKLHRELDGSLSFKWKIDYDLEAVYDKNASGDKLSVDGSHVEFDTPEVEAEVVGKAGLKVSGVVKLFGRDLLAVGGDPGLQLKFSLDAHTQCADAGAGAYFNATAGLLGFLKEAAGLSLEVSVPILKPDDCPVWGPFHIEDGTWVLNGKCTKQQGGENYGVPDLSDVQWKSSLEGYSWEELKAISKAIAAAGDDARAMEYAKRYSLVDSDNKLVGDAKAVRLTDGTAASIRIAGFRHEDLVSGGKSGITFEFADVPKHYGMSAGASNEGGWAKSEMRRWLNSDFYNLLPEDLKCHIVAAAKRTNNKGYVASDDASVVNSTADQLWLLSLSEVFGKLSSVSGTDAPGRPGVYDAEGEQYKVYADNGVTTSSYGYCVKLGEGSSNSWWLRSPFAESSRTFRLVSGDGDWKGSINAYYSAGVSPCFCF